LRLYSHRAPRSSPQTSRPATKYEQISVPVGCQL
jgi:hypothetical protein